MSNSRWYVPAAALGAAALFATSSVRADDSIQFATVGLVFSVPIGAPVDQMGVGVEASYQHFPDDEEFLNVGGFVQAQYLLSGGWRLALGVQPAFAVAGAEVGFALTAPHATAVSLGLHIAPYLSVGYGGVAFRWTRRLAGAVGPANDFAIAINAKMWFHLDEFAGPRLWDAPCGVLTNCSRTVAGRPLTIDGVAKTARLDHVAPALDRVAAFWTKSALDEHASIAAFARVSLQLMALGAPMELVARTHAAAIDEVDHARRCAALAERFSGSAVTPGRFPEATAARLACGLADFAVATLLEGCINEGAAAEVARHTLARACDAEVRASLAVIADDEARHAALAWETVAWCCGVGGDDVRRALAAALDEAPLAPLAPRVSAAVGDEAAEALGVPDDALFARCSTRALRLARRRYGRARPQHRLAA